MNFKLKALNWRSIFTMIGIGLFGLLFFVYMFATIIYGLWGQGAIGN